MTVNPNSKKVVLARSAKALRLLFRAGLLFDSLTFPIANPEFRNKLAHYWNTKGQQDQIVINESEEHAKARAIMGSNFLGISEVMAHFKCPENMGEIFEKILYSEKELRKCAKSHLLVADLGTSISNIRSQVPRNVFYQYQHDDDDALYNKVEFAEEDNPHDDALYNKVEFAEEDNPQWLLLKKTEVENSFSKTWIEQQQLISSPDDIPSARQMVYAVVLNFCAREERLFEDCYVSTSSVPSSGLHFGIGVFDDDGLRIIDYSDESKSGNTGVASVRKSKKDS